MQILIIRHGDPDYVHDSLTEKGIAEAECLKHKLVKMNVKQYYVSSLGRAKATIKPVLEALGTEAIECKWLREFAYVPIKRPDRMGKDSICWDWLPEDWTKSPEFFREDEWFNGPCIKDSDVKKAYDEVIRNFDEVLNKHGYKRNGKLYDAVSPNKDCIAFVCHFGLESVLLSHLLNISPMALWHGTCALPTSITTVVTEERREGKAYFRMLEFGSLAHLEIEGEKKSFSGRFAETFDIPEIHD